MPHRYIESLENWFFNTGNAILDHEAAYIKRTDDLIQLVPNPPTPLRKFFERWNWFRFSSLWRKEPPKPAFEHLPPSEGLHYSSDARIDKFVAATITVLGMIMLIVPLWVLASTHGTMRRLGVITGFVVLFLALVAFTTVARPFESLAAAAALSVRPRLGGKAADRDQVRCGTCCFPPDCKLRVSNICGKVSLFLNV